MSSQNPHEPLDPQQPQQPPAYQPPSYQPGAYPPPAQPGATEPPAYQPPAQPGGYQPGGYQPPAQSGGYQPPGSYQAPGAYQPPSQGQYQQPAQNPYQQPGAQAPSPYGTPSPYGAPSQPYPGGVPYPPVPMTGQLAPWGTRALGGLIDYVIPGFIINMLQSPFTVTDPTTGVRVGSGFVYYLIGAIGFAFYVWNSGYKQGTTGKSLGKQLAKTRLVSEATGQPMGFGPAVLRYIAHAIDSLICLVGWLFPLWDAKRQTIADKIMKTVVVRD